MLGASRSAAHGQPSAQPLRSVQTPVRPHLQGLAQLLLPFPTCSSPQLTAGGLLGCLKKAPGRDSAGQASIITAGAFFLACSCVSSVLFLHCRAARPSCRLDPLFPIFLPSDLRTVRCRILRTHRACRARRTRCTRRTLPSACHVPPPSVCPFVCFGPVLLHLPACCCSSCPRDLRAATSSEAVRL